MAGVDVIVDLGPGARIRGQVASSSLKNMVWIMKEPGSNLPGRWVPEDSAEAKAAIHHNAQAMRVEGVQQIQRSRAEASLTSQGRARNTRLAFLANLGIFSSYEESDPK
jgi:hypothetical protein